MSELNLKSARIRFAAAVAVYFLWVGALVAMAYYSSVRPAQGIVRPAPPALSGETEIPGDR
jgi:hypothetical protein